MAIQRDTYYSGRFTPANTDHPLGAFKNRSTAGAGDGSYLDKDWANDMLAFFERAQTLSGGTADGNLDTALSSQFYDWLMKSQRVYADVTYSVGGSGSDYDTINEALEDITEKYMPAYISGGGARVTINLTAGFTMAEQVIVDGVDLSWITITGDDASTTITRSALTATYKGSVQAYAFMAGAGGKSPIINQKFLMDTSGVASNQGGAFATDAAQIIFELTGAGVSDCTGAGCTAIRGGYITGTDFSGSGQGCLCSGGSHIRVADVSSSVGYGVEVRDGGVVSIVNGDATGCGDTALYSVGGTIHARGCDASGSSGTYGILASDGSYINIQSGNAQKGGATDPSDITVLDGSTINANLATGGVSQTANSNTSDGIIYQ